MIVALLVALVFWLLTDFVIACGEVNERFIFASSATQAINQASMPWVWGTSATVQVAESTIGRSDADGRGPCPVRSLPSQPRQLVEDSGR